MSVYFNKNLSSLDPYTPGEQPKDARYIKLNTNENPYFPSKYSIGKIDRSELENLRLYSDPENGKVAQAIAEAYGVLEQNVLVTNGSDEALAFCFAAFGENGALFPDVTYGFYKVFSELFKVEYREAPLREDFTVDTAPYLDCGRLVVLANPNAQTGIFLPLDEIEKIVVSNSENVVLIDEAYIDFGGESAVYLTKKYKNIVIVQTFSKSRSLAGARVGFAIADKDLIADLNRVKFSFNPYNVNRISSALAAEAVRDTGYFRECTRRIIASRGKLTEGLIKLGFTVLPSSANFVLAKSAKTRGEELYKKLKARGVLVRHFSDERIADFVRITVGTDEQIDVLLGEIEEIEK